MAFLLAPKAELAVDISQYRLGIEPVSNRHNEVQDESISGF